MRTVQLYGGGIDSLCISYLVKPDVKVYFNLGTEEAPHEEKVARRRGAIIDYRFTLKDQVLPNKILPLRNLLLVAGAAYYGNYIIVGSTAGDTTKDKDERFMVLCTELLQHVLVGDPDKSLPWFNDGVAVVAPRRNSTKAELVREYLTAGGSAQDLIINSRSCYHSGALECGVCRSCVRKYVALKLNGITTEAFQSKPDLQEAYDYALSHNRGREAAEIKECFK